MSTSTMWKSILVRYAKRTKDSDVTSNFLLSLLSFGQNIPSRETKQSKSSTEQKETKHTPTLNNWQDLRSCPFERWFSASLFCDVNFLDKLKATKNICYVIKSPNFGCNRINKGKV